MGAGPPRPNVEILPFQKRIDRTAQVEGKAMRFDPEKKDGLWFRRCQANLLSERVLFMKCFVRRNFYLEHVEPEDGNARQN
jgi:hypothetical protein